MKFDIKSSMGNLKVMATTGINVSDYNKSMGGGSKTNIKHVRVTLDIFF